MPRQPRRLFLASTVGALVGCNGPAFGSRSPTCPSFPEDIDTSQRPRLLLDEGRLKRIEELRNTDEHASAWYERLVNGGDELVATEPMGYRNDSLTLDGAERALNRVRKLGLLALLTEDDAYSDRAWAVLEQSVVLPDWNPAHFLDTATMAVAVALGYDWFRDRITEQQRERLHQALLELSIEPALEAYDRNAWWTRQRNNWGLVTNGGICLATLALAGTDGASSTRLEDAYEEAIDRLQATCATFGPNGGWPEGIGYWRYGTKFLVYALSTLANMGCERPTLADGVRRTGNFPLGLSGPRVPFNFGDSMLRGLVDAPWLFWLADAYASPAWAGYQLAAAGRTEGIEQNLLWYEPTELPDSGEILDRVARFPGASVVTFREAQTLDATAFLGIKADNTKRAHGDLDGGSFVFASDGVHWAVDLGRDDYDLPGYWDTDGERWNYYRKRAEGHNTLVFASHSSPDQDSDGTGRFIDVTSSDSGGFAITDLSALYPSVADARRGVVLLDSGSSVLIQDEVESDEADHLWWFMHTQADINTTDREATFTRDESKLTAELLSPPHAEFASWQAIPLNGSPSPSGQSTNNGVTKLVISLDLPEQVRLAVWLSTASDRGPPPTIPLNEWDTNSFGDRI